MASSGPVPHQASSRWTAPVAWAWESWLRPSPGQLGRAGELTSSSATQAQIQVLELAQPNSYPIYKFLELEGAALLNHSRGISITQDNSKISKRSLGEGPDCWCSKSQRPRTRPTTHCSEPLQGKMFEQKRIVCDTQ